MSEMEDCISVKIEEKGSYGTVISAQTLLKCDVALGKYAPPEYIPVYEKKLRDSLENKMVEIVFDYLKPPEGSLRAYGFDIIGVRAIKDNTIYVPIKYANDIHNIINHMYDLENENKELKKLLGMV